MAPEADSQHDTFHSAAELAARLRETLAPSSVIVCVGSDLCGDDGAGPAVAGGLGDTLPWQVLDTGNAPENFLGRIVTLEPESVLLVDALHLGAEPGSAALLDAARIAGVGPSTHGPAPVTFLDALDQMHPCRRFVLGIQPEQTAVGSPLSPAVQRGVALAVDALRRCAEAP